MLIHLESSPYSIAEKAKTDAIGLMGKAFDAQ